MTKQAATIKNIAAAQEAAKAEVKAKLRAQRKPVAKAVAEETKVEPITEDKAHSAYRRVVEAADEYFKFTGIMSWKRQLISFTLGLLGYGATFYFLMQCVEVLVTAVMLYTGIGFISFMVAFLGICLTFMAAWWMGTKVYQLAANFDAATVRQRVAGWFTFKPKELGHA